MIKNQKSYAITKNWISKFKKELDIIPNDDSLLNKTLRASTLSQIQSLQTEMAEFESLSKGIFDFTWLNRIAEIPYKIIQCRIALNLTQKQLADQLSIKEQQLQKWESMDYQNTSFGNVLLIIECLKTHYQHQKRKPEDLQR